MKSFETEELIGLFESIDVNEEKKKDLKSQTKMIGADSSQRIKDFAKEKEIKPKDIKNSYKRYLEIINSSDKKEALNDDDYDVLVTKVMMYFSKDDEKGKEEQKNAE